MKYTQVWYGIQLSERDVAAMLYDVWFASRKPGVNIVYHFEESSEIDCADDAFEKKHGLECKCDKDESCGIFNCCLYTEEQRSVAKMHLMPRAIEYFVASTRNDYGEKANRMLHSTGLHVIDCTVCCQKKPTGKWLLGVCAYQPEFARGVTAIESPDDFISWTKQYDSDLEFIEIPDTREKVRAFCASRSNLSPQYYIVNVDCSCT